MIPGTGTDWRLYSRQLERFPDMVIPAWIEPQGSKEPLEAYAARLAATLDTSKPFLLGGVSLGGMLAQEMARHVSPVGLVLIATAYRSSQLRLWARLNGKIMCILPSGLVAWLFRQAAAAVNRGKDRHKTAYREMLLEMPPLLVRWQSGAATRWNPRSKAAVPVYHIHGARDPVIPLGKINPQEIVKDGGHLINVTHDSQVNNFISGCLQLHQKTDG